MNRIARSFCTGAVALAMVALSATVHAQQQQPSSGSWVSYVGGAFGSTDYGTGLRLYAGAPVSGILGWEAQVTSYGSEKYVQLNQTYNRSAVAFGASAVARMPVTSTLQAFGKLGVHYLSSKVSGPGQNTKDNSAELGIGAGMLWQFIPAAAARLEMENIGGSGGNIVSAGLEFKL
ncbi:MAG: porin family protein [Rhizobacter sp.]|nr:porin family protein [Rhizobacter sp.]